MNIQSITNVSDCVPLYLPHSLYLKPLAKFYISVSLPTKKLDKTISNIDIMERLREAIKPDKYLVLKVSKTMLDFIRFEAELEDRSKLKNVLARLDGRSIKLSGYSEPFRVRAKDAKDEFPSRHDWDSFFRDAKNMDEMKAGERPDTVHISNLPIRWFCPRHMENDQNVKPSENIFKRIFEKFGSVRCVDIPICDPYRPQMKTEITGMKTFNFDQEVLFEGYVQFSEYVGFVRAMDEFRGMKLVRRLGDKNQAININVHFDKTKHLSDASIKRRNIVRDRLIAKERAKEEEETKKKREEQERLELERKKQEELRLKELEKQREREEKRKEKHLKKLREKGQLEIDNKIRREEKKLLIAQRKLESIRLLEALFERIKLKEASNLKKNVHDKQKKKLGENDLRNKLIEKYKTTQEEVLIKQKTKLEKVKGKTGLLLLLDPSKEGRSPSVNTISSDDSVLSDSHQNSNQKKKKSKKKKKHENSSSSSSDSSSLSEEEESQKVKTEKAKAVNPFAGMYPPEMTAEWLQMGMYPYPPTLFAGVPPIRPGFFQNAINYRGGYRGRFPRIRGRGRGRGNPFAPNAGMYPYDSDLYYKYFKKTAGTGNDEDYEDSYDDTYDRKRSKTYSRSKSRSRSRSRSHSRSRRRSKTRRSRSRRTRSDTRSRSRSHSRNRRSRSRSRSKSHSRSKAHSHTRTRSHKRSHSRSSSKSRTKTKLVSTRRSCPPTSDSSSSRSRSRSWSRNHRSSSRKIALKPDELVRSAKEIQQKVHGEIQEKSEKRKSQHSASTSRKRSSSVDSSKFRSPKRKEKSRTPDWKTNSVK